MHALYLGLCAGVAVSTLLHAAFELHRAPQLWYYPLERRWAFEVAPSGLAMDWFGRSLAAGCLGVVAFGLTYALARLRLGRWNPKRSRGLKLPLALGMVLLGSMSVYGWHIAQRRPVPLAPPAGENPLQVRAASSSEVPSR